LQSDDQLFRQSGAREVDHAYILNYP